MKTIIIYDQCGEAPLEFYVYNGDCTELDNTYVNRDGEHANEARLLDIITSNEKLKSFPVNQINHGDKVIVAGFLP